MRGLPWIRLDTDVREHPKSERLADALGERRAWTYMVELWLWVADNQPDGDLSQLPDSSIARRSGYDGDAKKFVRSVIAAGFMGDDRVLVGWQKRQGAIVAKFIRDRAKPDGRKSAKSGDSSKIPRGIQEGFGRDTGGIAAGAERDSGGIRATPARLPHGDVDVDVDVDVEQELSSGRPDALDPDESDDHATEPDDHAAAPMPRGGPAQPHGDASAAPSMSVAGRNLALVLEPPGGLGDDSLVTAILTDWRDRIGMPKAAITGKAAEKRRSRIRARLREGWTADRLAAVVTGALTDDWLMGRDPKSRAGGYRDVETVFRDNAQCERLEGLAGVRPGGAKPTAPARPHVPEPPEYERYIPPPPMTPEQRAASDRARKLAFGGT